MAEWSAPLSSLSTLMTYQPVSHPLIFLLPEDCAVCRKIANDSSNNFCSLTLALSNSRDKWHIKFNADKYKCKPLGACRPKSNIYNTCMLNNAFLKSVPGLKYLSLHITLNQHWTMYTHCVTNNARRMLILN